MENITISSRGFEKASDKLTTEQLNRSIDEVVVEPSTESVPEPVVEPAPIEAPADVEEDKVPKSRFLTVSQRAIDAENRLREYEAERAVPEVKPAYDDADLKKFYTETFGETEVAEKLYQNELARLTSIEEKAAERAFERFSKLNEEQTAVINERVDSFDRAFEELAIQEGKTEFTDDEQIALLDIVESYSPKDKDGKLIGDYLLPLDKAYEIYKVQNDPITQAKRSQRNEVASLSGARSEGTPTGTSDADWKPGQGRRWWNKTQ